MLPKYTEILEFDLYQKSDQAPFIFNNLECVIEMMNVKIIMKIHSEQSRRTYSIKFFNVYIIFI